MYPKNITEEDVMDDVKSATETQSAAPAPKKLSKKQSFPSQAEIVRLVKQNHQRTRGIVSMKQVGAFYTDHGS
jgi:hypothetical protein